MKTVIKTFTFPDWNINMLCSFALIIFLHFWSAHQMLSNRRVFLTLTWMMYLHYICLLLTMLKLLRAPGVSRDRMYLVVKPCKLTSCHCVSVQCKWLHSARTDWIHYLFATMNVANTLLSKRTGLWQSLSYLGILILWTCVKFSGKRELIWKESNERYFKLN